MPPQPNRGGAHGAPIGEGLSLSKTVLLFVVCCCGYLPGAAAASTAGTCAYLEDAVLTTPDYNNANLGIRWFLERGLKSQGRYGCMARQAAQPDASGHAPYAFALGCGCSSWETCHSRNLDYSATIDSRSSSRMGECRCCSWWLITLIVVGSLALVACLMQLPRLKKRVERWYYTRKSRRALRSATDSVDLAELEEGGSDGATVTELNDSRFDRRHSELTRRSAGVTRRTASNVGRGGASASGSPLGPKSAASSQNASVVGGPPRTPPMPTVTRSPGHPNVAMPMASLRLATALAEDENRAAAFSRSTTPLSLRTDTGAEFKSSMHQRPASPGGAGDMSPREAHYRSNDSDERIDSSF